MGHNQPQNRSITLDLIRGFAVFLMIIFHLSYDLAFFKFVDLSFKRSESFAWWFFPRIIVFLFLVAVGMGLTLAHVNKIQWSKFWKRWLKLIICAAGVSLSTYFMFPKRWVYFGTLHCIAVVSLMALPLIRYKWPNLMLGAAFLIPAIGWDYTLPFFKMSHKSMDYIPPFPWIGVVCLGIFLCHINFHQLPIPQFKVLRPLLWLGRHSLWIYLAHQPLLFGLVWLFYKILS